MKTIKKFIITFIITLTTLILLFIISSTIPKKLIKSNLNETSNYIKNKKQYDNELKKIDATKYDLYADVIILNLAVSQDQKHPFKSILSSNYYKKFDKDYKESLQVITNKSVKPNMEYLRYWHGSIMIIKPLLALFNLKEIIIFNYVVLGVLLAILLLIIYKKDKTLSLITFLAFLFTYSFLVPKTLEYTWNFYIAIIISILVLLLDKKGDKYIETLLIVSGVCTCFFDFLTTETITLLLPLTLLILTRYKENKNINLKKELLFLIKLSTLWIFGYVLTWISKWVLAGIVLKINVLDFVTEKATTRIYGKASDDMFVQVFGAVIDNFSNLMPFSIFKKYKIIISIVFILVIGSFFFLFRKENKKLSIPKILFLLALVPLIRFMLLSNHSYLHSFFTYRALLPSIICLFYIFIYGLDTNLLKKFSK